MPLAPVPTAVQILALRMFSHVLGQEASYTVLIELGLTELRSMRDSVAPRSNVDSRSHSDSRARLRKARNYIIIKPREERVRYLLVASWTT